MIINFSFSNFRSVKDLVKISFEASRSKDLEQYYVARPTPKLRLLKMAAIYGANASGKSNVVLALAFLRSLVLDPAGKKTDKIDYQRFAFDRESSEGNSEFNLDFVYDGIRYDYHVLLNTEFIVYESLHYYYPNKAIVFTRTTDPEDKLSNIILGSKVKVPAEDKRLLEANTLWNTSVLGAFLRTNIQFEVLKEVQSWFSKNLDQLITPQSDLKRRVTEGLQEGTIDKDILVEILRKADFNVGNVLIRDVKTPKSKFEQTLLKYQNGRNIDEKDLTYLRSGLIFEHILNIDGQINREELSFDEQSLGTKRFFQFAGLLDLLIRKDKIVVIDEIESSLHPDLLKHFLLIFLRNSKNSQLIFTTHQREFMRETDMLRNDIFHFTEKAEDGSTELFSFTDFNSDVIRKGSSLYNAYRIGKLGATPELDDAYITVD